MTLIRALMRERPAVLSHPVWSASERGEAD